MADSIHLYRKCTEAEVAVAFRQARLAMRRRSRAQLVYAPDRAPHENEMARLVLMGLAARAKFAHLYVEHPDSETQLELSYRAFERHQRYAGLLSGYPDPVEQAGFMASKRDRIFLIIDKESPNCFEVMLGVGTEREQLTARDAVINFIYKWCLQLAGDRPKNFQEMYKSRGATMCAANIRGLMKPYVERLPALSTFSHPATHYVIDRLLMQPPLPFGIRIPS